MCGIAGILSHGPLPEVARAALPLMLAAVRHRGPDDSGQFVSANGQAALAHTRLSILDLSPAGHQPMVSPDGRFALVFNGEIYNFRDLRASLQEQGVVFRSNSDTEVVLRAYEAYGAGCVAKLRGMFAFIS